jgi:hypothetical protein
LIGCTTLLAVSGILRTQAGRRGSGPGRWAGRDSALITPPRRRTPTPPPPPPLAPRAAGRGAARSGPGGTGRAGSPPPPPPLAPCAPGGGAHCALSPGRRRALPIIQRSWVSAGLPVGAPDRRHASPLMSRKGQQWGGARAGVAAGGSPSGGSGVCWAARRRAGSPARIATDVPARGSSGEGPGLAWQRVDRHQYRSRGCGPVEPGLSLARLLGWSAACTRSPTACGCVGSGFTGSGAVWILVPSLRVALGPQAVQVGRPSGRAAIRGPSCPGGHRMRTAGES